MNKQEAYRLILVVDDNDDNRELLNLFLSETGYLVVEATNGLEAIEIASKSSPDLILMDLLMPVMDGFAAVRVIRQTAKLSDIPIIACTALHSYRFAALHSGFDEFLTKPLDFRVLDKTLSQLLPQP